MFKVSIEGNIPVKVEKENIELAIMRELLKQMWEYESLNLAIKRINTLTGKAGGWKGGKIKVEIEGKKYDYRENIPFALQGYVNTEKRVKEGLQRGKRVEIPLTDFMDIRQGRQKWLKTVKIVVTELK